MKHFSKLLLIIFVLSASTSFAQTFKFGHINSQELIALMPDRDSAVLQLDKYAKDLQATIEEIQTEYQTKLNIYQQKQATWAAAVLEVKQKELQEIQSRFDSFRQSADQEYQNEQQKLFAPVFKKANETINKIGKDNGFTYIFDTSTGSLPFINTAQSIDITPMAKTQLGIPADKKPMQVPQASDATASPAPQTQTQAKAKVK